MKEDSKSITSLFKPYLTVKGAYKGGKSIVASKASQKVYKLSSNENPIGPSPKAIAAIKSHLHNVHLYPDTTDIRLRQALTRFYNDELSTDQFLCAGSGSEILDLINRGFLNEGDEVITSTPCFVAYKMFSAWAGAKIIDVPLDSSSYDIDVDGIISAINANTRMIYLTSPNNPTGTYIPKPALEKLLENIPSDIIIILDEVYWHFVTEKDYSTALPYISKYKNLIALNSFSKTFGLASLRVGYAYMNVEVADYLRQICKPFLITRLSLEGAIAALQDDEFIEETVAVVREGRNYLQKSFGSLNIRYTPSQANFVIIQPPIPADKFEQYLRDRGISVRSMGNFGAPDRIRISVGNRQANQALVEVLNELMA